MDRQELLEASALEQARSVRDGEVSAFELVEASIRRAEDCGARLGAFAATDAERALAAASQVTSGDERPFAGVPYAVKDLALSCAGLPHTNGSALFGDHVASYDSFAVARARAAGLIVIGTTVSCEFGLLPVTEPRRFGAVRNPHDLGRSAGGSSGGSAAAVADGALAISSASDAGGSIRIPAACCGLVGLKPSRGRISLGPDLGEHPLAVEGCLTRNVADTATFLDAVAGAAPGDATWAPDAGRPFSEALTSDTRLRIGVCTEPPFAATVQPEPLQSVADTAAVLADLGHDVETLGENPWAADAIREAFLGMWCGGAAAFAARGESLSGLSASEETLEPLTWQFVQRGRAMPAIALIGAQTVLQAWSRAVVVALSDYDAVLSPLLAGPPLAIGSFSDPGLTVEDALDRALAFTPFTLVANLTGQPALALPAGHDETGMPLSVQLLGRPAGEAPLLALGAALERAEGRVAA